MAGRAQEQLLFARVSRQRRLRTARADALAVRTVRVRTIQYCVQRVCASFQSFRVGGWPRASRWLPGEATRGRECSGELHGSRCNTRTRPPTAEPSPASRRAIHGVGCARYRGDSIRPAGCLAPRPRIDPADPSAECAATLPFDVERPTAQSHGSPHHRLARTVTAWPGRVTPRQARAPAQQPRRASRSVTLSHSA
jgi:hypothetical protein